jgi:hypothetical protein
MLNDKWAWIIWDICSLILIGDIIFNYLSRANTILVLIAMSVPLIYWIVRSAFIETLKKSQKDE